MQRGVTKKFLPGPLPLFPPRFPTFPPVTGAPSSLTPASPPHTLAGGLPAPLGRPPPPVTPQCLVVFRVAVIGSVI